VEQHVEAGVVTPVQILDYNERWARGRQVRDTLDKGMGEAALILIVVECGRPLCFW
jgi:hypothetical protein